MEHALVHLPSHWRLKAAALAFEAEGAKAQHTNTELKFLDGKLKGPPGGRLQPSPSQSQLWVRSAPGDNRECPTQPERPAPAQRA